MVLEALGLYFASKIDIKFVRLEPFDLWQFVVLDMLLTCAVTARLGLLMR